MPGFIEDMIKKGVELLANSYAPYSNIHVACVIYGEKGGFYYGVNVENASYGLTICAERAAIASMIANGERKPLIIVIVTDYEKPIPPCGACRQVIAEFNPNATIVMYSVKSSEVIVRNLRELFPNPFSLKSENTVSSTSG